MVSCTKNVENDVPVVNSQDFDMSRRTSKPNIILIVGDDVGYEIPTFNGGNSYETPNLDAMASQGMVFPNYFTVPDGPPGRLSMLTGKYCFRNWERFLYISPNDKTFANLLQNRGYETCFVGKWQLDGGHTSITNHGFDKYLAFMPFNKEGNNGHDQYYHRYKNPYLYENGNWLSQSAVEGKYSEDMMYDYAADFIETNKSKPFFLMYSHTLVQRPWSPPPTHPDFANWNPDRDEKNGGDKKYFPYMVKYMDQIIGQIVEKANSSVSAAPTLIIFVGDNATNPAIQSMYNGQLVTGSKCLTTRAGINVPMVVYGCNFFSGGAVDSSLVDVTDFMTTFAELAGANIPAPWGTIDGVSFLDNLKKIKNGPQRDWSYSYWPISTYSTHPVDVSFIFGKEYKKYDTLSGGHFFNLVDNPNEDPSKVLVTSQLTNNELVLKNYYDSILMSHLRARELGQAW
jgi:arylsulfatase A